MHRGRRIVGNEMTHHAQHESAPFGTTHLEGGKKDEFVLFDNIGGIIAGSSGIFAIGGQNLKGSIAATGDKDRAVAVVITTTCCGGGGVGSRYSMRRRVVALVVARAMVVVHVGNPHTNPHNGCPIPALVVPPREGGGRTTMKHVTNGVINAVWLFDGWMDCGRTDSVDNWVVLVKRTAIGDRFFPKRLRTKNL